MPRKIKKDIEQKRKRGVPGPKGLGQLRNRSFFFADVPFLNISTSTNMNTSASISTKNIPNPPTHRFTDVVYRRVSFQCGILFTSSPTPPPERRKMHEKSLCGLFHRVVPKSFCRGYPLVTEVKAKKNRGFPSNLQGVLPSNWYERWELAGERRKMHYLLLLTTNYYYLPLLTTTYYYLLLLTTTCYYSLFRTRI